MFIPFIVGKWTSLWKALKNSEQELTAWMPSKNYIKPVSDKSIPSLHQSFCFGTFSTQVHSNSLISFKTKK